MKRPIHLWILFALSLLMIFPAMAWLTVKAVDLDLKLEEDRLQTELARREAELQEKITSALYRMDWKLGPHIAREAARPYYLYESFFAVWQANGLTNGLGNGSFQIDTPQSASNGEFGTQPSPLLAGDSEFVQLHFQIDAHGNFSSPQRPIGEKNCQMALMCCGVTPQVIEERDTQIEQVQAFCSYPLIAEKVDASALLANTSANAMGQTVYIQPQIENFVAKFGQQIKDNIAPKQVIDDVALGSKAQVQQLRAQDRGGKEFLKRQQTYNSNTIQWADNNRGLGNGLVNNNESPAPIPAGQVVEGVMRPIWIGSELILARRAEITGETVFQCCWLSWDKIQDALREEVQDILPGVEFQPVLNEEDLVPGRALVTLPAQVIVDTPKMLAALSIAPEELPQVSGLQVALTAAWVGLVLTALAIGLLLHGVIQLSERRASFVSAVTHELRTPLTTFRMYSEMLAEKMVPPEKQGQYAGTLKVQAERLSHLVENVLQFARLERGPRTACKSNTAIAELMGRIGDRLAERTEQAALELDLHIEKNIGKLMLQVEPPTFEQILFNFVDNSCKYAAQSKPPVIQIRANQRGPRIQFTVRDFGPGVAKDYRKRLFQPFSKSDLEAANSAPGVGLGLALCQRMAQSLGGRVFHEPVEKGACFVLELPLAPPKS